MTLTVRIIHTRAKTDLGGQVDADMLASLPEAIERLAAEPRWSKPGAEFHLGSNLATALELSRRLSHTPLAEEISNGLLSVNPGNLSQPVSIYGPVVDFVRIGFALGAVRA